MILRFNVMNVFKTIFFSTFKLINVIVQTMLLFKQTKIKNALLVI